MMMKWKRTSSKVMSVKKDHDRTMNLDNIGLRKSMIAKLLDCQKKLCFMSAKILSIVNCYHQMKLIRRDIIYN